MEKIPNHICKACGKAYWACNACDENKGFHWRSVACSSECFLKYMNMCEKANKESEKES